MDIVTVLRCVFNDAYSSQEFIRDLIFQNDGTYLRDVKYSFAGNFSPYIKTKPHCRDDLLGKKGGCLEKRINFRH